MIVQCEECKTSFNLDEKRLRGDSAKVRCSKCKHVFMIFKEQEEPATMVTTDLFGETQPSFTEEPASFASFTESPSFAASQEADETAYEQPTTDEPFAATFDSISFDNDPAASATISGTSDTVTSDDLSFSDMSFSDETPAVTASETPAPAAEPQKSAFDEDMLSFADVVPSDEEITATAAAQESLKYDFSTADTPEAEPAAGSDRSFDFDFSDSGQPEQKAAAAESFDLGGFDFGAPTPEPVKESPAAFAFATSEPAEPTFVPVPSAADTDEESVFSIYRPFMIAGVCATALVTVLTVGYFSIKGKPGNMERMGIQNTGSAAEKEVGSFAITAPKARFIKNKVSGELFVVNGNATNNFKNPRTGVEVQVTLFSKNGDELGTKTAYCGSTIDDDQLKTMPLSKIEEELTKAPSDDPLENTPVETGKSTNCLVVFKDVPKQATDYGIEIIHSTGESFDDFK